MLCALNSPANINNTAANILEEGYNVWGNLIGFLLSTGNRLYVGWFGTLMLPLIGLAIIGYITAFINAPPVDIDGIREPVDKRKPIKLPQTL